MQNESDCWAAVKRPLLFAIDMAFIMLPSLLFMTGVTYVAWVEWWL